jgi:hypothetical protein
VLTALSGHESHEETKNQMHRYCLSVVIHFVLGHEFGHYCYADRDGSFEEMRKLAREFAGTGSGVDERVLEEVFCDLMALENCLFQLQEFRIPPSVTIFASTWLLELISGLLEQQRSSPLIGRPLEIRKQAMVVYWGSRVDVGDRQSLRTSAQWASEALRPVGFAAARRAPFVRRSGKRA